MNSIDQRIQAALSEEDQALLDQYSENQNIFSEIIISFRGIRGLFVALTWVLMFVWGALFVFCTYRFLSAGTVEEKITWLGGGLICFFTMLALKLWYFMDMNRSAIMREFKRLELQLSLLADKK